MKYDDSAQLLDGMRSMHDQLNQAMKEDWDRSLPLNELIGDRWARAKNLDFGEGASIYDSSFVFGDVSVGTQTWIGPFTILDGSGGLSVGAYCSISSGVQIYTHDTVKWALSGGKEGPERSSVSIGDCCYIGSQVVVAKGVSIGHHCVIGAGSFVNRDIPPLTVAAGTPCRRIGRVRIGQSNAIELEYDQIQEAA